MTEYVLKRTGQRPLKFEGEQLAQEGGKVHNGREMNRWYELAVYKTTGGTLLLEIVYRTCWEGESDTYQVIECTGMDEVDVNLQAFDPVACAASIPAGTTERDRAKYDTVRQLVRASYEDRVTQLFEQLGEEAVEEIK